VTLAVFFPTTANDFIDYDDGTYIFNNRHVRDGLSIADVRWALTSLEAANWHPLTWISLQLDAQLCGHSPAGPIPPPETDRARADLAWHCHLTNALLHAGNTALLLFLLWRMTGAVWRSAIVAALFGLHPLHVESVAWAAERKDVLSSLFWMLTLWAYWAYVKRPGSARYLLVVLAFAAGLASKPMLVTLPFVLLLLDYWPLGRLQIPAGSAAKLPASTRKSGAEPMPAVSVRRALCEKMPLLILTTAACILTWIAQSRSPAVRSLEEFPLLVRLGNVAVTYCLYIGKMFWPLALAPFYPLQRQALPVSEVAAAVFSLAAVSLLVLYGARRFPYLSVGWCWYLGTLVPVIGLVQVGIQSRADRYTYLPLIGLFIMIVWGAADLAGRWRLQKAAVALAVLWLVCLTWLTHVQIGYWANSYTIWRHALAVTVDNSLAHTNLGGVYMDMAKIAEEKNQNREAARLRAQAEEHFQAALRVNPDDSIALSNMAVLEARSGRLAKSLEDFRRSLALNPRDFKTHFNFGLTLMEIGKFHEAIDHLAQAADLEPNSPDVQFYLGRALVRLRKWAEAVSPLTRAVELAPERAEYRRVLGLALYQFGDAPAAMNAYQQASRLEPGWPNQSNGLAWTLATSPEAGRRQASAPRALELALQACQATREQNPQFVSTLAAAYAAGNQFPPAIEAAARSHEAAVRLGIAWLIEQTQQQLEHYRRNEVYLPEKRERR
jgi:tetratricopeptide (TPR) repeat protein